MLLMMMLIMMITTTTAMIVIRIMLFVKKTDAGMKPEIVFSSHGNDPHHQYNRIHSGINNHTK